MIDWPWIDRVTHKGCFCDSTNEGGSHHSLFPSNPSPERVVVSLVKVCIEIPNYLLLRGVVILHHVSPSLGIQHCLYPCYAIIKIWHNHSPLHDNPTSTVVEVVMVPDHIPPKTCVVIDKVSSSSSVALLASLIGPPESDLLAVSMASTSSITTSCSDLGSWVSYNRA